MKKLCCEDMNRHTGRTCDEHENPFECPDYVISYSAVFDEYGLIIHDGGSSKYTISFCPFCGAKLPESKRERWFDELEKLGFDEPIGADNLPEKYKSDAWYRST